MYEENTYLEVVWYCSLGSPVVSIRSIPVVVPSSGELPMTTQQCHHPRVVDMTQVTQHLVY
jgi:hypothetical protein